MASEEQKEIEPWDLARLTGKIRSRVDGIARVKTIWFWEVGSIVCSVVVDVGNKFQLRYLWSSLLKKHLNHLNAIKET